MLEAILNGELTAVQQAYIATLLTKGGNRDIAIVLRIIADILDVKETDE